MTTTSTSRGRRRRLWRHAAVAQLARAQGGVLSRAQLRELGISRFDVRNEVSAGRWKVHGSRTVQVGELTMLGRYWMAVFELGATAALDGVAALVVAGLTGFTPQLIDVSMARGYRPSARGCPGTKVHQHRERGHIVTGPDGLPIVAAPRAAVNAAMWARSDREAATLLCMVVQQRVVAPHHLGDQWALLRGGPRAPFLDVVIEAVSNGVHALSELDFARECRERGLPEPTRQAVRTLPSGRAYLDAEFAAYGFAVEIDGAHHAETRHSASDMLRQNEVVIGGTSVLRVPLLGYHLDRDAFMNQVERLLLSRGWVRSPLRSAGCRSER